MTGWDVTGWEHTRCEGYTHKEGLGYLHLVHFGSMGVGLTSARETVAIFP